MLITFPPSPDWTNPNQNELGDMLRYMRPAGSMSEKSFRNKFLTPLDCIEDQAGNMFLQVGNAPILWSSHTDTVHTAGGRQTVNIKDGVATTSGANCLGADCTTGVWIMMHMIRNKVPGLYMFHDAEEKGCVGSRKASKLYDKVLNSYKYAIAFDRKGTKDIITYQRGNRCCSDEFAASLGLQLGNGYVADDGGVYTDTAEYTDQISECTNISVGYYAQHTHNEAQLVDHAMWLADRMCHIDLSKLVHKRKPGTRESKYPVYYGGFYKGGYHKKPETIYDLLADHPWYASKVLEDCGVKFEEFRDAIDQKRVDTMYPNRRHNHDDGDAMSWS